MEPHGGAPWFLAILNGTSLFSLFLLRNIHNIACSPDDHFSVLMGTSCGKETKTVMWIGFHWVSVTLKASVHSAPSNFTQNQMAVLGKISCQKFCFAAICPACIWFLRHLLKVIRAKTSFFRNFVSTVLLMVSRQHRTGHGTPVFMEPHLPLHFPDCILHSSKIPDCSFSSPIHWSKGTEWSNWTSFIEN